jgi:trehalose 6-phosphate phosphatase
MTRSPRAVPHLSKDWERIAEPIHGSRRTAVFLDFDGTLVPIAPRPNQVRISPDARRILKRLALRPRATVAVVSGRRRVELQHYVGIPQIHYFGLYGWDRGHGAAIPASVRKMLPRAWSKLSQHLYAYPSVWIENKRNSLSIHLLDTPPRFQERVRREIRSVIHLFERDLQLFENLRDIEIVPRSIPDKGASVREFLAKPPLRGAFPIYFGDDLSDEPAFAAVRKGVSVLVGGKHPTCAQYHLRGPGEVVTALTKLEAALA